MKKELDTLLQKQLSRRGFLKTVGIGAAAIIGVAAVVKTLDTMTKVKEKTPKEVLLTEEVKQAGRKIDPRNKIIRTICYFAEHPSQKTIERLNTLSGMLEAKGYTVQTKRICGKDGDIKKITEQ